MHVLSCTIPHLAKVNTTVREKGFDPWNFHFNSFLERLTLLVGIERT